MNRDLTQGKPAEHLLALTIPSIWGALAVMLMNLADTWFIGRLSSDALAAVSFTFPVVMFISSIALGIGTAALSLISRAIGNKQPGLVEAYCTHTLVIALGVGLLFSLLGLVTIEPLFQLLGAPNHLLPLIKDYMVIWYLSSVLVIVTLVANAIIRASGNTRFPSLVLICIAVLNFILTPLLMFGTLGLPRLELQGAALATSAAFVMGFFIVIYHLKIKLKWINLAIINQNIIKYWKAIFAIAIPNTANSIITPITVIITVGFIAKYGSDAVAGYGVASRISALGLIVLAALSSTLALFAGQHWGARKMERMDAALKISFGFAIVWSILLAALFWLFAPSLISLFTNQALAIESASHYLYIIPISFSFLAIVMIGSAISNGLGKPMPALLFTVTRLLLLYLPLVWLLSNWLGLDGVYAATAIANVCVGLIAFRWIRQQTQKGRDAREQTANRKALWDEHYLTGDYIFGTEANSFLKQHLEQLPVGNTLSIGEGEGQNAVLLASQGHTVTALDASAVGLAKATNLAAKRQVSLEVIHADLAHYQLQPDSWDSIVSLFCHLPETLRKRVYKELINSLKPGGYFILEVYSPKQFTFKDNISPPATSLVNLKTLKNELNGLQFIHAIETSRELQEGLTQSDYIEVVQIIARRPLSL